MQKHSKEFPLICRYTCQGDMIFKEINMDLNVNLLNSEIEMGLNEMFDKYVGYVENTLLQEEIIVDLNMLRM